ncbi:hypothetical protein [Methylobacterium sp. P5_C11]
MPPSLPFDPDAYFAVLEAKRDAFMDGRAEIDTVIVGSSHGDYGVDPAHIAGSFNLCTASQDMRQSAMMYAWAARRNRRLRRVIVVYSLFSYGFDCARSADHARCVFLRRAFGFRWSRDLDDALWPIDFKTRWPNHPHTLPPMDRGFARSNGVSFFEVEEGFVARRVARHMELSEVRDRGESQLAHLHAIMVLARRRGDQVVVVIPPVRSDYHAAVLPGVTLFGKMKTICMRAGVPLVDTFDDPAFVWSDFGDPDHLYPDGDGSRKLAARINIALKARKALDFNWARALHRVRSATGI